MRAFVRAGIMLAMLAPLAAGQLSAQKPDKRKPPNPDLITREQIQQNPAFKDAYQVVQALHSSWLVPRSDALLAGSALMPSADTSGGTGGMKRTTPPVGGPGEDAGVRVYVDGGYVGSVDELKNIPVTRIQWIRHYVGNDAQTEFGIGNAVGVIIVSTMP